MRRLCEKITRSKQINPARWSPHTPEAAADDENGNFDEDVRVGVEDTDCENIQEMCWFKWICFVSCNSSLEWISISEGGSGSVGHVHSAAHNEADPSSHLSL